MMNLRMVKNEAEWNALPEIMKAVQWFRVKIDIEPAIHFESAPRYFEISRCGRRKLVERFEVTEHILTGGAVTAVVFENSVKAPATLVIDDSTGAFAVKVFGKMVLKQGGFGGFIPSNMEWIDELNGYFYDTCFHNDSAYATNPYMPW